MRIKQHNPPHPGGFIKRNYLEPFGLDSNEVSKNLMVNPSTLNRLVNEKTGVSPSMALKLSKVLGRSPESWLQMQNNFSLQRARNELDISSLEAINFAVNCPNVSTYD